MGKRFRQWKRRDSLKAFIFILVLVASACQLLLFGNSLDIPGADTQLAGPGTAIALFSRRQTREKLYPFPNSGSAVEKPYLSTGLNCA